MSQYQFQAPPLTKFNKILLITTSVFFLVTSILKAIGAPGIVSYLGLSGYGMTHGLVYQLATYPLIETQFMSYLFNALVVWFIGSELEASWGLKVYSRFVALIILSVGILFSLVSIIFFYGTVIYMTPLHGLNGMNFALLMAYALLYPDRQMSMMMIFPMKARTFCFILAGIEAYMAIFNSFTSSWAHLLAMGVSFLIIHFQSRPLMKLVLNKDFKRTKKSHLYVVKDDDKNPPKYWQ